MKIYPPEEIQKRIEALPPDIRSLVYSADMDATTERIAKKHQLHIDQIGLLGAEVVELMIGLTDPNEFVGGLADTLRIDKKDAEAIVQDFNTELFDKIRESMKKAYEEARKEGPPITESVEDEPVITQNPPAVSKSVVMPSSVASLPKPATIVPPAPQISTSVPSTPMAPKPILPTKPAEMHPTDLMMTEKTLQVAPSTSVPPTQAAKQEPPKPVSYKADPYREPPE